MRLQPRINFNIANYRSHKILVCPDSPSPLLRLSLEQALGSRDGMCARRHDVTARAVGKTEVEVGRRARVRTRRRLNSFRYKRRRRDVVG